jgi:hypothetical protein
VWTAGHNFKREPPKDHLAKFGLIWFSGFKGGDLNVKAYEVRRTDGRQVMTKAHIAFG